MEDLSNDLLAEILCRSLPGKKSVFRSMCVCKRWLTFMSSPHFINHFLCHQKDKSLTPTGRTFISRQGKEPSCKSGVEMQEMLKRIKSFYSLKEELVVVATYNDLVLCCESKHHQQLYYICNPYTKKWVALPPTPTQCHEQLLVGIVCDAPYYMYLYHEEDADHNERPVMRLNVEYRCRVVRILPPDQNLNGKSNKFNVEIFSFETGEWRESVMSSPRIICYYDLHSISYAWDGRLYWWLSGQNNGRYDLILRLDPFSDTDTARMWFEIVENYELRIVRFLFPYNLRYWPTPVPKLPQLAARH